MRNVPGRLVVISGPSGSGKTTLLRRVFAAAPVPLQGAVSATTRPPRRGEQDGSDYYFLSREEFQRRREAGEFLEACEVYGRGDWYGTLNSEVTTGLQAGKWVVLEIDVQGTRSVLERFPDAVTIFIKPSSIDELRRRLEARGTEAPEAIHRRLEVSRRELESVDIYQYQVTNDNLDEAVAEVCRILTTIGEQNG